MAKPAPPPLPRSAAVHEGIDPRWLLKAAAAAVLVAAICGYISVCALFWQGQWQLVLHPSHTVAQTPAVDALSFETLQFGPRDTSGKPQLSGWFLPSDSPTDPTVLLLHSGDGSMSDALPTAQILHSARLSVLLFDYRGYGASGGPHPTEQRMQADAESALDYLAQTRNIPLKSIIPFGTGVGASLAVRLSAQHPELPAVVLDDADGDLGDRVAEDPRARMVPAHLLLNERFSLAVPLTTLATPKLIITRASAVVPLLATHATDPKMTVEFPHPDDAAYLRSLRRFLDTYVASPMPALH